MKLFLIDGNSIINRAYFALPVMSDERGRNVNAVYGFVSILLKLMNTYQPTHLTVAFDQREKTFRHLMYENYKASRKGMPDDLAAQLDILKNLLETMNINFLSKGGLEADDILGTIAKTTQGENYIVTGDRDLFQLIDDQTTVLLTKKGVTEVEWVDEKCLLENYHMTPSQVIEYKALRGDASDDIPGVYGIGEKTAMSLLSSYGDVDNVYKNIDKISGSLKDKLVEGRLLCYLSRSLATIKTDAQIDWSIQEAQLCYVFPPELRQEFEKLKFKSLYSRLTLSEEQTEQTKTHQVERVTIESVSQLKEIISQNAQSPCVAVDLSCGINFAFSPQVEYQVATSDDLFSQLNFSNTLEAMRSLFEGQIKKIVYDAKKMRHTLHAQSICLSNVHYDVSIMKYLVEYSDKSTLDGLLTQYGYSQVATGLYHIGQRFFEQIERGNLSSLYLDIELPLSQLLFEMELRGINVNKQELNLFGTKYKAEIEQTAQDIYTLVGQNFNISSPKQLASILFEQLSLPSMKKTKTGFSTDNEVLEELIDMHPVIPLIIRYRQITKLYGTYIEGLGSHIKNGKIHTTYNQTLTATGRLSSSEPNLQNIPNRDNEGRELRRVFVPSFDYLVSADYSQIELRLLAVFSDDDNMKQAFNRDEDIHKKVASEVFEVPVEMVTDSMRRLAKSVNFGIIYGISDYGLAKDTKLSTPKARQYINKYFASYPSVKQYLDSSIEQAEQTGYVLTMTGRRRQIPELKSKNFQIRSFGRRAAMNMPLQGSAADIIKIAMLRVDGALKQGNLQSKIVLQIHDELVVDCVAEELEQVKAILKQEMENAVNLSVKLSVNISFGGNLYDAK